MKYTCQANALKKKNVSHNSVKKKKIGVVGLGGIGSLLTEQLVRMGFTQLVLMDGDVVDESNLARQSFDLSDIGTSKISAISKRITTLSSELTLQGFNEFLTAENTSRLMECDVILDATDNLHTRYIINRFCYNTNIPWIYASAIGSLSSTAAFIPGSTPCLECVYGAFTEESEMSCSVEGVLLPALMETVSQQIILMMRVLSGSPIPAQILTKDVWENSSSELDTSFLLDSDCESCQTKTTSYSLPNHFQMKCSGNSIDVWLNETSVLVPFILQEFKISKKNPIFLEFLQLNKRILIYPEKKITFHHFSKEEIQSLFKKAFKT